MPLYTASHLTHTHGCLVGPPSLFHRIKMSWITEKRGSHLCEANHRKGSALKKRSGWLMSTLSSAKKVKTPLGMKPSSQARLEWSGFQSSPVGWPVHINPAVCQKQFHRFCVSFFDRPCRTMSLDQNPPPHGRVHTDSFSQGAAITRPTWPS